MLVEGLWKRDAFGVVGTIRYQEAMCWRKQVVNKRLDSNNSHFEWLVRWIHRNNWIQDTCLFTCLDLHWSCYPELCSLGCVIIHTSMFQIIMVELNSSSLEIFSILFMVLEECKIMHISRIVIWICFMYSNCTVSEKQFLQVFVTSR
jgi:hypothetical protein